MCIPPVPSAVVQQARRLEDARAADTYINTPPPVYVVEEPPQRPARLAPHDANRIRAAVLAGRKRYPGPVADLIATHLNFHADQGWAGDPRGEVARLCAHLLGEATP